MWNVQMWDGYLNKGLLCSEVGMTVETKTQTNKALFVLGVGQMAK